MPKKDKVIQVPESLLNLLMAEPEDLQESKKASYKDIRETAKAMARLLIES